MRLAITIFLAWVTFSILAADFTVTTFGGVAGGLWDQVAQAVDKLP